MITNQYQNIVMCPEGWRAVFLDNYEEDFELHPVVVWALDAYGKVVGLTSLDQGSLRSAEEYEGFVAYAEPEENPDTSERFSMQQHEITTRRLESGRRKILEHAETNQVTVLWATLKLRVTEIDAGALLEQMREQGMLKRVDDPSFVVSDEGFYYEKVAK